MAAFEPLVEQVRPDVVVVVGDVNSTLACALVAAKSGALLAHVEAGLRSRDWSMPEEVNRVVTDRVSDYLLAPSADAVSQPARTRDTGKTRSTWSATSWWTPCWPTCDRALARDIAAGLGSRAPASTPW